MEMIRRKLQEQNGEISLRLSLILLGSVVIFLIAFNVHHAYQTTDRIIDRTNEAVLAVAAENGPGTAKGIRESAAVARRYDGAYWRREVSTDAVIDALETSLRCTAGNNYLVQQDGAFRLDNVATTYVNADGDKLHFRTTMDLTIYLVGGSALSITVPLEVTTTYESKF